MAIKALRVYKAEDLQKVRKVILPVPPILETYTKYRHKMFYKEVVMWKRVSHPNIVPFLGVSEAPAPLSMISEWMLNGNVRDHIRRDPETSRLQLVCEIGD